MTKVAHKRNAREIQPEVRLAVLAERNVTSMHGQGPDLCSLVFL